MFYSFLDLQFKSAFNGNSWECSQRNDVITLFIIMYGHIKCTTGDNTLECCRKLCFLADAVSELLSIRTVTSSIEAPGALLSFTDFSNSFGSSTPISLQYNKRLIPLFVYLCLIWASLIAEIVLPRRQVPPSTKYIVGSTITKNNKIITLGISCALRTHFPWQRLDMLHYNHGDQNLSTKW